MERRLAAILAADVVGYSKLMGEDQSGTLAVLKAFRSDLMVPVTDRHQGRLIKSLGDGWLLEFPSIGDAVDCAIQVHSALSDYPPIQIRTGIHIGDVTFDEEDVFGDGVNIAARLEQLALPGEILISDTAYQSLDGKSAARFSGGQTHELKNIARPVAVWRWPGQAQIPEKLSAEKGRPEHASQPVIKPTIAILPFSNLSGDAEQEFFADGMTADIISGLSKFSWLFVISRNSSLSYKGQDTEVRQFADELGVRYVLEGSIRQAGNRVRISCQLIDADTSRSLWAERYDRTLDDIFEVQDEVTAAIIAALAPEINLAETQRVERHHAGNLDAWAFYQKGMALFPSASDEDRATITDYFDQAIAIDPSFVDALTMAAHSRCRIARFNQTGDTELLLTQAEQLLDRALRLDPKNSNAHAAMARFLGAKGALDQALEFGRDSVSLNPNSFFAILEYGVANVWAGQYEEAIVQLELAEKLSPKDPLRSSLYSVKTFALFNLGRFDECVELAYRLQKLPNPRSWSQAVLVAVLAELARWEEAELEKERLLSQFPNFKISSLPNGTMVLKPAVALRKIGLPE